MIDNTIRSVTEKLSSLSYIEGVVLGGSRTRGTHTEDSDIDFGIYYNSELFDITVINQLATESDDGNRSNLIVFPGTWDDWINGGEWLVISGYHVSLILRDARRVVQIIKDTEQGIATANYQIGHPHGYTNAMYRGELAISKILHTNDGDLYEFKEQAEYYPTILQKGLTELFMSKADFSLMFAGSDVDRGGVSYVCRHCFRSISFLNQVLFAVSKEHCINGKKAVKMIGGFKIKPSDREERAGKVISLISTNVDCARRGVEIL